MSKLTTATLNLASLVLLALVIYFWFWLYQSQSFAFGLVTEIHPRHSDESVLILKHYKSTDVALKTSQLSEVKLGNWLLVYGKRWDTEGVLSADSIHALPMLKLSLLRTPQYLPGALLQTLTEHTFAALTVAVLLLLMAKRILQLVSFALICILLALTLWHGTFVAHALGWLTFGKFEHIFIHLATVLYSGSLVFYGRPRQLWPARLIAATLAYAVGEPLLQYFGITAAMVFIVFIVVSAWLPLLFTAVLAAFLLANALSAPLFPSYLLLSLCMLISFSQLRFAVERKVIQHLPPNVSRSYVKLKRQLSPQTPEMPLSGKVSLIDALKTRGVL